MKNNQILIFTANKKANMLILLSLVFSTIASVSILRQYSKDIWAGYFVIATIANLLAVFYASSQVKIYVKRWIFIGIGIVAFQVIRLFLYPSSIASGLRLITSIEMIISIVFLIFGLIIGYKKIIDRENYIKENSINSNELVN